MKLLTSSKLYSDSIFELLGSDFVSSIRDDEVWRSSYFLLPSGVWIIGRDTKDLPFVLCDFEYESRFEFDCLLFDGILKISNKTEFFTKK